MRVIYFDVDCGRRDHFGSYGYWRETTPVMDRIAETGMVFDRCYASDTPCLPSRAALFTCRPGIANGVISHEWPGCNLRFPGQLGMPSYYPEYTMPMRLLQENGCHTVTFSIFAQRHAAWWFNAGFSEVSNPTRPTNHENSDSINPRVTQWIRNHIRDHENLFMHVNYWDAHTAYRDTGEYRERVAKHEMPDWPGEAAIKDHYENFYGPKTARDLQIRRAPHYTSGSPIIPDEIKGRADYKVMLDSYDGSLAKVDACIGEVIEALKAEGVYEDTAIIISADHGEAMGEGGIYFEHGTAHDCVTRVPLIVRWPGLTDGGGRCDRFVYQYDFMATVMELLGVRRPELWDAQSFSAALEGKPFDGRPYVVCGNGLFTLQRAVTTYQHAYMRTLHSGCYPYDSTALYDLGADPYQTADLKEEHPGLVAEMEKLYADWWSGWCCGPDGVVDPMMLQVTDYQYFPPEQMFARLEAVGRQDQIEDLRGRLARHRRAAPQAPAPNPLY